MDHWSASRAQETGLRSSTQRRLFREVEAREVDRFELLWDLVVVSASHIMAEAAMEELSAITIARFLITFLGVIGIWQDLRRFHNASGHDDLLQVRSSAVADDAELGRSAAI